MARITKQQARQFGISSGRNKFGVDITPKGKIKRTYRGRTYDSIAERDYAEILDIDEDIKLVIPQPIVQLGEDTTYKPDFFVIDTCDLYWFIDVKGKETQAFRKIKKLWAKYCMEELHVIKKKSKNLFFTYEIIAGGMQQ